MTAKILAAVIAVPAAAEAATATPCADAAPWPQLERYAAAFISGDGRVIDHTQGDRSTSEGQAYALFFSLVAGDRALFDRVLRWTEDNLAQGDLGGHLPAWKWGRGGDGRWGVLDANSASDADLWLAYSLLEAGRLWAEPRYGELARRVLANVAAHEVAELPALGPMLLPAPRGFELDGGRAWRLNPSYLAPQLLRRFASAGVPGPWRGLLPASLRLLRDAASHGFVADWVTYGKARGLGPDQVSGPFGSYDAIRSYLWIGMLPQEDPARRELAAAAGGPLRVIAERGELPERIDLRSAQGSGRAPVGFYAALLPLAQGRNAARELEARVAAAAKDGLYGDPPTYYDQNLVLFARGFIEGRYRFTADGELAPVWEGPCSARQR